MEFIIEHWAELLLAVMAFAKAILNLVPTEHPSQNVFEFFDKIVTAVTGDRRKSPPAN